MTDAEQQKIDAECQRRDIQRCGLTFDKGRLLTKKEIAALVKSGRITPLAKVQQRDGLYLDSWLF